MLCDFAGEVAHKTQVVVPITIMNKATPVFEKPFYTVSVPENIRMHSAVISIQASSPDNRKLIYSISKGDIYGEFSVDFQTGIFTSSFVCLCDREVMLSMMVSPCRIVVFHKLSMCDLFALKSDKLISLDWLEI